MMTEPCPTVRSEPQFFLGIGAQRAGTSWLSRYFERHPEVYFSPIKELHYFDALHVPECKDWDLHMERRLSKVLSRRLERSRSSSSDRARDDEIYQALLLRVAMPYNRMLYREYFLTKLKGERAFGEISPSYALLPREGLLHILDIFPDARFIFVMRNPVDRFWSALHFRYRGEGGIDLNAKFIDNLADWDLLARTYYQTTLEALDGSCKPDRVLAIFYEDLFGPDSRGIVKSITNFIGAGFVEPESETRVNESSIKKSMSLEMRRRAARTFSTAYDYVAERFGSAMPEAWRRDMGLI